MNKQLVDFQKRFLDSLFMLDKFPSNIKEDILNYVEFRNELTKESDRGCALLAASYLDHLLEGVLKTRLIGSDKHLKTLLSFNGPLGTFSSRILMSYSMGIIPKVIMDDLQIIRKIRNDFGHSPIIISFENERIKSLSDNLKLISKTNEDPRSKFITSVFFVLGTLTSLKIEKVKFDSPKEIDFEKIKNTSDNFRELLETLFSKGSEEEE